MTVAPPETQPDSTQALGSQVANYWGTDEFHKFELPDGVQWIEFKIMNEGAKTRFQKLTNQDLTIGRDQTAKVRMDPAEERHTLIKESVTDWHLFMPKPGGGMEEAKFSGAMLQNWLNVAPPEIVEELETHIRKANPWMTSEMTVEAVDKEMARLRDLRKDLEEREQGEARSATK